MPIGYSTGILPVEGFEEGGVWHRDTYELFTNIHSSKLPPYYINCLIWLSNDHDSPTLIHRKSHIDGRDICDIVRDCDHEDIIKVSPKKGQVLLFDGRVVHRGGSGGDTNAIRKLVYSAAYPFWYTEPTE